MKPILENRLFVAPLLGAMLLVGCSEPPPPEGGTVAQPGSPEALSQEQQGSTEPIADPDAGDRRGEAASPSFADRIPVRPVEATLSAIGRVKSPEQAEGVRQALIEELVAITQEWKKGDDPVLVRPRLEELADRLRYLGKATAQLSGGKDAPAPTLRGDARNKELARFFADHPEVAEEARQAFSAYGMTDCDGWQSLFQGLAVPGGEVAR
ncbi:MAG: hypothetical protein AB7I98_18830 [Verrucomicrobiales bacterium]|nr:hypothetical protein [Verrucomicrobiae bacterium]MCP5555799.1 hypothetical protein [Akkermansiaceae bacterium]